MALQLVEPTHFAGLNLYLVHYTFDILEEDPGCILPEPCHAKTGLGVFEKGRAKLCTGKVVMPKDSGIRLSIPKVLQVW